MVEIFKEDKGGYVKLVLKKNGVKEAFKYVATPYEDRPHLGHACRDLFTAWCVANEDFTSKFNDKCKRF